MNASTIRFQDCEARADAKVRLTGAATLNWTAAIQFELGNSTCPILLHIGGVDGPVLGHVPAPSVAPPKYHTSKSSGLAVVIVPDVMKASPAEKLVTGIDTLGSCGAEVDATPLIPKTNKEARHWIAQSAVVYVAVIVRADKGEAARASQISRFRIQVGLGLVQLAPISLLYLLRRVKVRPLAVHPVRVLGPPVFEDIETTQTMISGLLTVVRGADTLV